MNPINQNRIRKLLLPGAIFFLASMVVALHSLAGEIFLTPPGLRPVKDPTLVIPTDHRYPNKLIKLPAYRDATGNPAHGWSGQFVDTRRFVSNQSAWVYFRNSDLKQSVVVKREGVNRFFRFWPTGTTMVIESYRGNALKKKNDALIDIAVMLKIEKDLDSSTQVFYPVNWAYASFNPDGSPSITSAKVRDCHQCHSIAFHFTGDLVFTHFK